MQRQAGDYFTEFHRIPERVYISFQDDPTWRGENAKRREAPIGGLSEGRKREFPAASDSSAACWRCLLCIDRSPHILTPAQWTVRFHSRNLGGSQEKERRRKIGKMRKSATPGPLEEGLS
jgi:hypothetical protein